MTAHFGKIIAYFRVSTDEQGKSGLRLEAQWEAVLTFLNGGKWTLVAEFVEVERGKRNDRRSWLPRWQRAKNNERSWSLRSSIGCHEISLSSPR